jgi:hypothetical protein
MIPLDSLQAGRAIRGKPKLAQARFARWTGLGLLACVVLSQGGCASDPCGGCHGFGLFGPTGFFARTSYRLYRPVPIADPCCGAAIVGPAPVTVAAPAATVVPAAPTVVGPSMVAPSAGPPSSVPAAPPERLEPVEPPPSSRIESQPRSGSGPKARVRHRTRPVIKPGAPTRRLGSRGAELKIWREQPSPHLDGLRGRPRLCGSTKKTTASIIYLLWTYREK